MRTFVFAATIGLVALCGCGRTAGPVGIAPTTTTTAQADSRESVAATFPELRVQSQKELDFGSGTKGRIWNLTGQQFKSLSVRLIVARDGKKEPGTEITCTWDEPAQNVDAQLALLLQDGSAFGAKGKRLPCLTLQFRSGNPDSSRATRSAVVHDTLPPRSSSATTESTVSPSCILFHELSGDSAVGETITIDNTEKSLLEASKNKRMVVGVLVEWKR